MRVDFICNMRKVTTENCVFVQSNDVSCCSLRWFTVNSYFVSGNEWPDQISRYHCLNVLRRQLFV